jgi:conjugative relaxase-like TrwC/TraI family protein
VHLRPVDCSWLRGGVVLSVAKLTLGQEAYYEQAVAAGLDDYNAGRGESPGLWSGSGAEAIGLVGVVGDGDLGRLLGGRHPASDETLRLAVAARRITVERLDPASGERISEAKRLLPVTGFDLVFSCPKSVSLLHALTDDEAVRRAISDAHEAAWRAALDYLEREACVVRRGQGGAVREHGEGFVAAAFRHRTSRAQDPHLHTHVIVANLARSADGAWRALDGAAILTTYRLAAGYLYEAQLRHELGRSLGVTWTEPRKGMSELAGVPEAVVRAFSRRRQQLVEHLEAHGIEGFAAARVAALATRERKEEVDLEELRETWRSRAAELGLGRGDLDALLARPALSAQPRFEDVAGELLGAAGLTATRTTFSEPDLVCRVAGAHAQGAPLERLLACAGEIAALPAVRLVEAGGEPGRPARFTTSDLLAVEHAALGLALDGRGQAPARVDGARLAGALARAEPRLSAEQRQLVHHAALSPDRVVCVIGHAGAGKTTALRVLAHACTGSGVAVYGAAPSGRAADELAAATGIAAKTLHRLVLDAGRGGGLPPRCLVVVDEAGMADTRVLASLLEAALAADARVLLVGDTAQLPAVGAGGLFAALCDRLGAHELVDNRRQLEHDEALALLDLRHGTPERYLLWATKRGRLQVADDAITARATLLADWWHAAQRDPARSVMLAHRRDDVDELNSAARHLLRGAGQLAPDELHAAGRAFAVGDRVVCRHNDDALGVHNGQRATVLRIDDATRGLLVVDGRGQQRTLPAAYLDAGHVDHAYALTVHAAQGATVDRAFVLAADHGALREWGYVACSRARIETRLYVADDDQSVAHDAPQRRGDAPAERLAAALTASIAEQLATDATDSRSPTRDARPAGRAAFLARLEAEHRLVARAREKTADRLAANAERLRDLGWLARRRQAPDLEAALRRDTNELHHLDQCLRSIDDRLAALRAGPNQDARRTHDLEARRAVRLARERETGDLTLEP